MNSNKNDYITTEQAAGILYVTAYTIREYIKAGKLKAAKIGKRYLLSRSDVVNFLSQYTGTIS